MKATPFLLALGLALGASAPSYSQAARTSLSEWAGPIGGAFRAYGTSRMPELGTESLGFFAESVGQNPAQAAPKSLSFLTDALEAAGITAEKFSSPETSLDEKMSALTRAALTVEAAANADAARLTADLKRADENGVLRQEDRIRSAFERRRYLRSDLRQDVEAAAKRFSDIQERRYEAWGVFSRELGDKIAARAFDAAGTFLQADGGWRIADASPVDAFPTLREAYLSRLAVIRASPAGPWSLEMLDVMDKTLDRADVIESLEAEDGAASVDAARALVAAARAETLNRLRESSSPETVEDLAAFAAYRKSGRVPPADAVLRLKNQYVEMVGKTSSRAVGLRIDAAIKKGEWEGRPSWETVRAISRAGKRAGRRLFILKAVPLGVLLAVLQSHLTGIAVVIAGLFVGAIGGTVTHYHMPLTRKWDEAVSDAAERKYREALVGNWPDGHFGGGPRPESLESWD